MRTFLAIVASSHYKEQPLTDHGSPHTSWKSFDVNEDFLPAQSGLNKSKATVVVPSFQSATELHRFDFCEQVSQLSLLN